MSFLRLINLIVHLLKPKTHQHHVQDIAKIHCPPLELKTLAQVLSMLGPNATSRKNEMTSGTFGVVSLAQQLPSKPKTQGWLRIYIWTDCKRRLTFAFVEINHDSSRLQTGPLEGLKIWGENSFVCLIVEINHDLSRLQAGQGRRIGLKIWGVYFVIPSIEI